MGIDTQRLVSFLNYLIVNSDNITEPFDISWYSKPMRWINITIIIKEDLLWLR